jgi:hypothetical protein
VKAFAWIFGLAIFGGLIVMAVAGFTAATAILVTTGAIIAMIGLGNIVGGRTTPNRVPRPPSTGPDGAGDEGAAP